MPERQRRVAVTELQRKQIRQYAKSNPLSNQVDIANWATREFGRKIGLQRQFYELDVRIYVPGYIRLSRKLIWW